MPRFESAGFSRLHCFGVAPYVLGRCYFCVWWWWWWWWWHPKMFKKKTTQVLTQVLQDLHARIEGRSTEVWNLTKSWLWKTSKRSEICRDLIAGFCGGKKLTRFDSLVNEDVFFCRGDWEEGKVQAKFMLKVVVDRVIRNYLLVPNVACAFL